jgi:hypothetical protein
VEALVKNEKTWASMEPEAQEVVEMLEWPVQ